MQPFAVNLISQLGGLQIKNRDAMQRFYKYEGMFFGFASGIVGWMSSDLLLQIVGGLATIAGCLASVAGFVQRLYELEKAKKDLELAELNKQLLEKQLKKEV